MSDADLFVNSGCIDYPVIDSDAHVLEPPGVWQERVPTKYRNRAPKVVETEKGPFWSFDDGKRMRIVPPTGIQAPNEIPTGPTYDTMWPSAFDTKARLAAMDADGIHAACIFPTVALEGAKVVGDDRELQRACVRAYNEWILEFCEGSNGRLIGQALLPTTGVKDAIDEMEWALDNGHKGVLLAAFPNGTMQTEPEDDQFWAIAQERGAAICLHIGQFVPRRVMVENQDMKGLGFLGLASSGKAGSDAIDASCLFIFSGVPQRFPRLKFALVESAIGWIPSMLEQVDDLFYRLRWFTGAHRDMKELPSEIFNRNFWCTFLVDTVGMELRYRMNLDHLMWSTDFPHTASDFPNSRVTMERNFRGLPKHEVKKFLHTNARNFYGLDHIPESLTGADR